jgi:putative ABC transport system permease protein
MIFKILIESIIQAFQQIWGNKLRSFLTLLGIIIGIWCIITVLSAVDSLEANIRSSFEKLGDDVVYVQKFPWGDGDKMDWEKILRRPEPDFKDYEAIQKRVKVAEKIGYSAFVGMIPAQYRSNSLDQAFVIGVSFDYGSIFNIEFDKGRYFSPTEHFYGSNKVVIGYKIAEALFGENIEPIGKEIKVKGQKYQVIGVTKKEGSSLVNPIDFDEVILMSIYRTRRFSSVDEGAMIAVKAAEGISLDQLKDELTVAVRSSRRLKPKQEDDFALNQLSVISSVFDSVFGVLNIAGFIIGGFSMIVGLFSVANIMFVSVKERTSIIGVKKALGAKSYMILIEFLVESIILCFIGGAIGLFFVYLTAGAASGASDFQFFLSEQNIIIGSIVSVLTGILSGIIPAIMAANMSPVEAMRH